MMSKKINTIFLRSNDLLIWTSEMAPFLKFFPHTGNVYVDLLVFTHIAGTS